MRIETTAQAEDVVARVRAERPGAELVFVFGSGCCEGTAPHLFTDYTLTPGHEQVGTVAGVGVFADAHVRGLYAGRTIVVDAEADPWNRRAATATHAATLDRSCDARRVRDVAVVRCRRDPTVGSHPLVRTCPSLSRISTRSQTVALANIATRLKTLEAATQERVINWGYAICDAAMRRHVDSQVPLPAGFPYPASGLG